MKARPQSSDGESLLVPAVAFVVWLAVVVVVGLTALRLAWKVLQYAWS